MKGLTAMTNKEMLEILDKIAPFEYAESWDNSGMIIDSGKNYSKALIALDLTEKVIDEAAELGCGAVVCHHPAIFGGIKSIRWTDPVYKAVQAGLSVFAVHTNFDAAAGGVNDVLASALELKDTVLMGDCRDGRIGTVPTCSADDMAEKVKSALALPFVEVADAGNPITKVCVVGGSGGSFSDLARSLGCDMLITGECKHSDALHALSLGLSVIAAGHYETENPSMPALRDLLNAATDKCEFILSSSSAAPFERI